MVNESILGALKSALSRGESLKKAMMTVYNAGYKKEEISEAARVVNEASLTNPIKQTQQPQQKQSSKTTAQILTSKSKQSLQQSKQSKQPLKQSQQPNQQKLPSLNTPQKVSGYGQQKPKGKAMIILLGFLLLLLIGALATIFLFREELLTFLNSLFS